MFVATITIRRGVCVSLSYIHNYLTLNWAAKIHKL